MNTSSTQFLFTLSNLDAYTPSILAVGVAIVLGLLFIIFSRFFLEYLTGTFLVRHDRKVIEEKKSTLSDLILMKDIQTELEKEIEQAALKATFQG